jgi:glycosyl transferase family 25
MSRKSGLSGPTETFAIKLLICGANCDQNVVLGQGKSPQLSGYLFVGCPFCYLPRPPTECSQTRRNVKTYLINLDRRPDRLARMQRVAAAHDFTFERISGVDAKAADFWQQADALISDGPTGRMSHNTLACTLSHFKAWETFVNDPDAGDHAVFLEDDVVLSTDFAEVLTRLAACNLNGYGLVKLEQGGAMAGGAFVGRAEPLGPNYALRQSYQILTDAAAYVITRTLAQELVKFKNRICAPVDHFLFYPLKSKGFWGGPYAVVDPAIAIQDRKIASDIAGLRYTDTRRRRDLLRLRYEAAQLPTILRGMVTQGVRLAKIRVRNLTEA